MMEKVKDGYITPTDIPCTTCGANYTNISHKLDRLRNNITFWQGKFRIVCHENNKLREKLMRITNE